MTLPLRTPLAITLTTVVLDPENLPEWIGRGISSRTHGSQPPRRIDVTKSNSRWFSPGRHADRRPFLIARNRIIAAMRGWFEARDFIEVDCGALQISPGNE